MTLKTTQLRDAITFALAVGTTALAGTGAAVAQDAPQEATTLDRIEVTGSRIKRTDIETSQPIFSLSRDDIQAQGLTSVGDVIQNLTANGSTLNTSFNNGGNGETRVSLRNLGSNRTLVLVNGRRWVGGTGLGGAVDLNTIPTAAVERIEVLKDGASTIYGSDAISGVVNVILRQNFEGAEANAYLGQFDKGDGSRQAYDFTIGTSSDRFQAMLGVGYVKEEPVMAGDREISKEPVFGSRPGTRGSLANVPANVAIFDGSSFNNPDGDYGIFVPDASAPNGWRPFAGLPDQYNFAPANYLLTPQERYSVFGNASLDITDDIRFKTTVTYNSRRSTQLLAATPLVIDASSGDAGFISADSIYNPFGQDINEVFRRMTETGGRIFDQDVRTVVFDGAFEGTLTLNEKPYDWEAGYFYGENKANNTTNGLFQTSHVLNAAGPSFVDAQGVARCGAPGAVIDGCVPINLLGAEGSVTQDMLDYSTFVAHDELFYKQKTYYANIGGEVFDMPAGALAFSFGMEHRTEFGYDSPDALINSGDTSGNARTATRGGYSLDEAYLELAIPVLADLPGAKLLDFSLATRYSDYSNFGDTLNSKFGFRWKPIDDLMVRGNWSEGFRAPSISELFTGQADSFPAIADPCAGSIQGTPNPGIPAGCAGIPAYNQPNGQVRITVGGNPDLGPEKSETVTFGFVYSPSWAEGLDVSLDWWQIEIDEAIFLQTGQAILDNCYRSGVASACALISRTPSGQIADLLSVPTNIGKMETEGFDMTVGYRLPETSWGKFSFTWDTTYVSNLYIDTNGDGLYSEDPISGEAGNNVGEYFGASFTNNWRIRSNLQARWEMGDWGVSWFVRYFSPQEEICLGPNVPANQRAQLCSDPTRRTALDGNDPGLAPDAPAARPLNRIPSATYNDMQVSWQAPWNAKVSLGINNIFDRDPPVAITAFANSFDPAYDVPGRFFYMTYNQKF
ncbi:TonB-dependent receptor [Lysobacter sp. S4-A87]|uniref:TonB-dependent receptor plug domain-containing protein n=1 Tax=Lysobacter sp. S4-A87 TaxID=2925843 RepID=UPI001F53BE0F|nr:TonB-dependent receptor [Lysobacter sp. S4-A87]UNK50785.1 TonB-dependent receptor [Lysobacter sp. S4-A87]